MNPVAESTPKPYDPHGEFTFYGDILPYYGSINALADAYFADNLTREEIAKCNINVLATAKFASAVEAFVRAVQTR